MVLKQYIHVTYILSILILIFILYYLNKYYFHINIPIMEYFSEDDSLNSYISRHNVTTIGISNLEKSLVSFINDPSVKTIDHVDAKTTQISDQIKQITDIARKRKNPSYPMWNCGDVIMRNVPNYQAKTGVAGIASLTNHLVATPLNAIDKEHKNAPKPSLIDFIMNVNRRVLDITCDSINGINKGRKELESDNPQIKSSVCKTNNPDSYQSTPDKCS